MKKAGKIILITGLALLCFAAGFFGRVYVESHPVFPWTRIYAASQNGTELLNQYFDDVKFEGKVLPGDDESPLQYSSGDWEIQTDAKGENIIAIALTADAAKEAEEHLTTARRDIGIVTDSAETELEKYVDIKYYLDTEVTEDGNFYRITVTEKNNGRETGAEGYFVYYTNGTLFSAAFSERVLDFPENEEIITPQEAYDIAYNTICEERKDLEMSYDFSEDAVTLTTAQIGQVYHIELYGERDSMEIYCICVIYACTGKVEEIGYSDR